MTPVLLLSDGYIATSAEPWRLPDVSQLPDISVPFAVAANGAVITEAGEDEGIWIAEFDLVELRAFRRSEKHRNDYLRPGCYAPLGPSDGAKSP